MAASQNGRAGCPATRSRQSAKAPLTLTHHGQDALELRWAACPRSPCATANTLR